jgi:hypothetical protein
VRKRRGYSVRMTGFASSAASASLLTSLILTESITWQGMLCCTTKDSEEKEAPVIFSSAER